jgi:hypothetical protein
MTNNVETEVILKEEALKYVLEYTCIEQLLSFRDSSGKKSGTELEWPGKI